jgi:hypothetical protein
MKIKRFNEFGKANLLKENTELINSILDKISKLKEDGKWIDMEKSLTDYERSVLKSASEGDTKYNTMEEDINSFLDEKFGNLSVRSYNRKSFGFPVLGYYFIRGEENHLLLNLELSNNSRTTNILYVDYRSLKEIKDRYGLEDKDLDVYIKKWFMECSYINEMKSNKELPLPYNFEIKKISLVF